MKQLFRQAALDSNRVKWMGEVILIRPVAFRYLTGAAVVFAMLIAGFLVAGSYTRRSTVTGHLVPDPGLVKIYVPQSGIIVERRVSEGQAVNQGELLYVVSSDRESSTQGGLQTRISRQVAAREESLRGELKRLETLQGDETAALNKKVAGLIAERANVAQQLQGQLRRITLAEDAFQRNEKLLAQGYISKKLLQQKQIELLDQRNRLQVLERDQISTEKDLQAQLAEATAQPLRQQNQRAQLERILASTNQELAESEARRRLVITAPKAGIITAVSAEVGQAVDVGKPLLRIVPTGAILHAELYAQSRSIGFIKTGDAVLLRYQSYPYQKFGHAHGVVAFVSKTALPVDEFSSAAGAVPTNGEPLYRITVRLSSQAMTAYGHPQSLQAGMLVDADILQEKRKLYEWVMEPLYGLAGRL